MNKKKICLQPTFSTLFVTPLKACLVECTEVAPSFSSTPLAEMNVKISIEMKTIQN